MRRSQRNKASRDNRNKVKLIIRNRNFVRGAFPKVTKAVKRRNLSISRVLHSFTDTSGSANLIKYSSFLVVKNVETGGRVSFL